MITDSRFASVHSDPRFQNVPRQKSKVAIDSRFDRMFSDKSFTSSSVPFDKRGKSKKIKLENPLRHYYRFDEEDAKEEKCKGTESDANDEYVEEEIEKGQKLEKLRGESLDYGLSDESEHSGSEDDIVNGDSEYSTDTGDEDVGEDVSVEEDEDEGNDEDESAVESVPVIDKETHRLAVVNMDWRHVLVSVRSK